MKPRRKRAIPLGAALAQALDEFIVERPTEEHLHLAILDVINRAYEIAEPSRRPPRARGGRPRKLDEKDAAAHFASLSAKLSKRARIARTARDKGVSPNTVKAALKKVGQKP